LGSWESMSGSIDGTPVRRGRALKLYLVDGAPSGVTTAELGISSVGAVVATRTALPDQIRRRRQVARALTCSSARTRTSGTPGSMSAVSISVVHNGCLLRGIRIADGSVFSDPHSLNFSRSFGGYAMRVTLSSTTEARLSRMSRRFAFCSSYPRSIPSGNAKSQLDCWIGEDPPDAP
jgi:hypothetical protein